jgi:hypothetical protein
LNGGGATCFCVGAWACLNGDSETGAEGGGGGGGAFATGATETGLIGSCGLACCTGNEGLGTGETR